MVFNKILTCDVEVVHVLVLTIECSCWHVYNCFVIPLPGFNIHINIYFLMSLYQCAISTSIYISLLPYSELQLMADFMLYKYIPANPSGRTL